MHHSVTLKHCNTLLSEALENDSQYQILKTKLDSLNLIEDKNEMQRFEHQKFKKMTHLGELIAHYQLIGSGKDQNSMGSPKLFENFFNNNGGAQLPSEIGRRHLMFCDNAVQVEGVPWLVCHHSWSEN